jgi:hypothetical protein
MTRGAAELGAKADEVAGKIDVDREFPQLRDDRHDAIVFRPRQGDDDIVDRPGSRLPDKGIEIAAQPKLLRSAPD